MTDQALMSPSLNPDPLLNDHQAARILGTTSGSLKQSRYEGKLFGRPAPKFIKLGKSARYKLSTLTSFLEQFPEHQNTSEYRSATGGAK